MKPLRQSYRLGGHVAVTQTTPVSERPFPFPPLPVQVVGGPVRRSLDRAAVLSAGGTVVEKVSTALAYVIVGTLFWLCKVDCHRCGDHNCTEDHDE